MCGLCLTKGQTYWHDKKAFDLKILKVYIILQLYFDIMLFIYQVHLNNTKNTKYTLAKRLNHSNE